MLLAAAATNPTASCAPIRAFAAHLGEGGVLLLIGLDDLPHSRLGLLAQRGRVLQGSHAHLHTSRAGSTVPTQLLGRDWIAGVGWRRWDLLLAVWLHLLLLLLLLLLQASELASNRHLALRALTVR